MSNFFKNNQVSFVKNRSLHLIDHDEGTDNQILIEYGNSDYRSIAEYRFLKSREARILLQVGTV